MASDIGAKDDRPLQKRAPMVVQPAAAPAGLCPIVALGASAGGLEVFRGFLDEQSPESGFAFVLIQHLDPTHPSLMAELLTNHTSMTVTQAVDGEIPQPNRVYLIPPGAALTLRGGALRLSTPIERHGGRLAFDTFLASLAAERGPQAVCVILSGTGTDGGAGALAIAKSGGLVIAQDPQEAEFDGMPRNAVATGAVALVLSVAEMPDAIYRHFHPTSPTGAHSTQDEAFPTSGEFRAILDVVKDKTALDFEAYKYGTLERRLAHRMSAARVEDRATYLKLLRQKPGEAELLQKDLLIGVTRFFRGKSAFDFMADEIIPDLINRHKEETPLRVWCPGSSTGEEPYSIAMLFLEAFSELKRDAKLQIFASDINADAVAFAREGRYPKSIEQDVAQDRLARFFVYDDNSYRASQELRDTVVFTVHDILADAPFSNIDFATCRNLLIYLRTDAQKKVMSFFHFALRNGGVLFLGGSEAVGSTDRFEAISKKHRFYRHIGRSRPGEVTFPSGSGARLLALPPTKPAQDQTFDFDSIARQKLLGSLALCSVLIDGQRGCLHITGATEQYLKVPSGVVSRDLLAMVRDGLRPKLRSAIDRASREQKSAIVRDAQVTRDGDVASVCIVVEPIKALGQDLLLVSFLDGALIGARPGHASVTPGDNVRIAELEHELKTASAELEATISDLGAAREEQRRIAEQALSLNEEAQSTNEELVTSKEELQSVNEELTALNGQLHETLERQRNTANDLQNILESSGIATIFLDEELKIRFFTPAAMSLFRVIASDVGRPLADFTSVADDKTLMADAAVVLDEQSHIEREVSTPGGVWFSRLILPYRTHDGLVEGVIITFTNITERKRAAEALDAAKQTADQANAAKSRFLAAASHDLRQPLQTIRLLHGLLTKTSMGKDAQTLLKRLDATVGVMSGMLNTLLDINQLEAGVIHADIENFPLNELFEHLQTDFAYHMRAQNLEWRVVQSACAVRSDPRLLEQILRNLLSNAVKFTPSGKVLLGCRRRGRDIRIEVWDTGPGIPDEDRRAIFEEFHQMNNPARERSKGLGLGLAIVQRLAKLLGHVVDLKSTQGKGSMFSITIPCALPETSQLESPRRAPQENPMAQGARILIVEDDPTIRELLEMLLQTAGHRPTAAADGAAALSTETRPDVIVADFNLPNGPNGVDVIAGLRKKFQQHIPAIVLTGDISTQTLRAISENQCTHLDKPVEASELLREIARLVTAGARLVDTAPTEVPAPAQQHGTIFVVDDEPSVRDSVRDLLHLHGWSVETFASCELFLQSIHPDRKGCLVIDAMLPGMDGFELLARLTAEKFSLPSIMITGHGDISMAVRAMQAGARDFLEKPFAPEELIDSITHALEQGAESDAGLNRKSAAANQLRELTLRQRQILDLVIAGHPSKNIAADLGISQRTVENHRAAIMKKTGSRSIPALIRLVVAAN